MTLQPVPHLSEGFWDGGAVYLGEIGESAYHYWVGSSPRLSVKDGDIGYGRVLNDDPVQAIIGVRLAPVVIDITKTVRMSAQVRIPLENTGIFVMGFSDANVFSYSGAITQWNDLPRGEWLELVVDYGPDDFDFTYAETTDFIMYGYAGGSGTGFDLSWLELRAGAPIPTRVYPRADGLGMGAPRLMDGRSPYRSPRVFGTI